MGDQKMKMKMKNTEDLTEKDHQETNHLFKMTNTMMKNTKEEDLDLTEKDLLDHQEMHHSSKEVKMKKEDLEETILKKDQKDLKMKMKNTEDLKEKDLEDPEETNHLFNMMNTIITMNTMMNT